MATGRAAMPFSLAAKANRADNKLATLNIQTEKQVVECKLALVDDDDDVCLEWLMVALTKDEFDLIGCCQFSSEMAKSKGQ